jgi:uncharacterized protein
MKQRTKIALGLLLTLLLIIMAEVLLVTKDKAHMLVTSPMATRGFPDKTPADFNMPYEDVTVTDSDGLQLVGWFVPSKNGAVIIMQHGYKSTRQELLDEAQMMYKHGYGVLLSTVRAHDHSEGEMITFGLKEVNDMDAWYQYLLTRQDVDPNKIGELGNSYGGMLVIQYAARNKNIKAVVADSAFSSLNDTVSKSVTYFTNLPAFPFAPLIVFWAEHETGAKMGAIDTKQWIAQISPRPVFLMQGGKDIIISTDSGQKLYDAAGEPKELWYDPNLGHVQFDTAQPSEFEKRVSEFFDKYLLGK